MATGKSLTAGVGSFMSSKSCYVLRLPAAVVVAIFIHPLAVVLSWSNLLRRRDLTSPHKGLWIVLCLVLPVIGPLLYLGVGRGQFELNPDRISAFFVVVALVLLIVEETNRLRGNSPHSWHGRQTSFATRVHMPAGAIPYLFKRSWTVQYRYACLRLRPEKGLPPNTFLNPVLHFDVGGSRESTTTVDSQGTASHVFRFTDGGTYSIRLHIRRGCAWSLRTSAA